MALVLVHLVARIRDDVGLRIAGERAAWLWTHLRSAFPNVLAAILMPNHLHVVTWVVSPAVAHTTLVRVVGAFVRRVRLPRSTWERVPPPRAVDGGKEASTLRYVALNPTAKKLARDPLEWYWSTHLDVVGAVADPWVSFDAIRLHLPSRLRDVARLHDYVSGDHAIDVAGTRPPTAARDTSVATRTLDDILVAATAATRSAAGDHRRRGPTREAFVWLAATQGWRDVPRLAEICGLTRSAIFRILQGPRPRSLDAARLFLGDDRLLTAVRRALGSFSLDAAMSGSVERASSARASPARTSWAPPPAALRSTTQPSSPVPSSPLPSSAERSSAPAPSPRPSSARGSSARPRR